MGTTGEAVGGVVRLLPGPPEELAPEDVYADLVFPRPQGSEALPHVAINMVSTLDGRVSIGGKASPIGSRVDRSIMRNIRRAADAVLVGAGTVRAEEMNLGVPQELAESRKADGRPEQPLGVVLAGSGELPLGRKVFVPGEGARVVVVAGDATPEKTLREASDLGVSVLRAEGSDFPQPPEILRLLKQEFGIGAVLLEGGPTVNGSFLASDKVDELFLTLSPKISRRGEGAPPLAIAKTEAPAPADFDLASIHSSHEEGELYLRYLRRSR